MTIVALNYVQRIEHPIKTSNSIIISDRIFDIHHFDVDTPKISSIVT